MKTQFVVYWPGQNMFGPFRSAKAAQEWARDSFGPNWFRGIVHIWVLEKPNFKEAAQRKKNNEFLRNLNRNLFAKERK